MPIWNQDVVDQLDVIDLFAGRARIAKLASWVGLLSRAYDINFCPVRHPMKLKRGKMRRSPMDLNGAAGLALLGRETIIIPVYPWFFKLWIFSSHKNNPLLWSPDLGTLIIATVHAKASCGTMHQGQNFRSLLQHCCGVQFMVSCQSSHFPKRYFDTVGTIFAKRCQCWQPNGSQVGTPKFIETN